MNFRQFQQLLGTTGGLHGWKFRGYKGWQFHNMVPPEVTMDIVAHGTEEYAGRVTNVHLFLQAQGVVPVYIENSHAHFSRVRRRSSLDPSMRHVKEMIFISPDGRQEILVYRVGVVEPVGD